MTSDTRKVCILLPVLNEMGNIQELLDGIDAALHRTPYLVCVVDDGSTDGTHDYLERVASARPQLYHVIWRRKTSRGSVRGSALHEALIWGLAKSEVDVFVEMDGDLSHRPEELAAGVKPVRDGSADVVVASKYLPESGVTNRSAARRFVSWMCNAMVRALLSPHVRDYSNGYRFYSRRAAEVVASTRIKYGSPIYLSEVMGIWLRARLSIVEIPTTYIGRNEGISKLRFIDLVKAGLAIFEIAVRLHLTGFAVQGNTDAPVSLQSKVVEGVSSDSAV